MTVRQIKLDFGSPSESSLNWYDNNPALTEFFHALSATFPAGETFFVKSVINFRDHLKAAHRELWSQVQLFLKQESAHSAIHDQWNARIAEENPSHPMLTEEKSVEKHVKALRRMLSPLSQLAITACLEHWTSGLSFVLLGSKGGQHMRDRSKEPYRSLWVWHALEELEHKKVAFDVYQAMGGGYLRRTAMMLVVSPVFMARVAFVWWKFCRSRDLPIVKSSIDFLLFQLWSPGIISRFVPYWLTWFRPNFHPACSDKAESPVLEHWRAELDAKRVPLNNKGVLDKEMKGPLVFGPSAVGAASTIQSNR